MSIRFMTISDGMLEWLQGQERWEEIYSVTGESRSLPFDVQTKVRSKLMLNQDCQVLLGNLLQDSNGIPMVELGVKPYEVTEALQDGECSSARLVNLGLARIQDRELLKPLPIAFNAKVQFLVGLTRAF